MTREEAIKHIITYAYYEDDIPLQVATALDMAISALRAQQEQESKPLNGWISVQDRLPEVGGYVVCIAKRNPFSRFMPMVARIKKNGWANPITEQYISEVTHWMPMPEPPEKEKTEE